MSFFDQLSKKIVDAGQDVSAKTKNFAEITKLNGQISDKEKQIEKIYQEIGKSYCEAHQNEEDAEFADFIADIKLLMAEIEDCREQIREIKGIRICETCGAEVPIGAAFCSKCGTKQPEMPEEAVESADDENKCPHCGAEIEAGAVFCNSCGKKIEDEPASDEDKKDE